MKAIWSGNVIAESNDTVVDEGNHYFPHDAVKSDSLAPSDKTTICGWEGRANDDSLDVDGAKNADAAWYYAEPLDAAKEIAGRVAFWKGRRGRGELTAPFAEPSSMSTEPTRQHREAYVLRVRHRATARAGRG